MFKTNKIPKTLLSKFSEICINIILNKYKLQLFITMYYIK